MADIATPSSQTLGKILDGAALFFERHGIDSPRATAEFLAARLLKRRRAELPMFFQRELPPPLLEAMRRGTKRVASGEPLQYVIGQWDFRGITIKTDPRALIPRPETEQLVGLALASRRLRSVANPTIIDYGTGSGCIALAIAKELPTARILALDVSDDALALAKENAEALGLTERVALLNVNSVDLADVLDPASIDAIVSNPPYIPSATVDKLSHKVLDYEPRLALDGGDDGMDILRRICDDASMVLASGGEIFFELDAESGQGSKMGAYLHELGFEDIRVERDMAGAERFLAATLVEGV